MTKKPRGLSVSDAIFARNLVSLRPMETVMPQVFSTSRAMWASVAAAGRRNKVSVPDNSRNASSRDKGSTSGVAASKIARICAATRLYFAISGLITTACGHSSSALNIGIAERGPYLRAM